MTSRRRNARVAGILYILASAAGVLRLLYIPGKLFVHGNAAATANNIAAHESLFRLGIASEPLAAALWLFVPLALYRLLKEVDPALAVLMVILGSLMQVPLFFFNSMTDAAALLLVRGADYLCVVDKPQRDALAMLFIELHGRGFGVAEMFWGLWLFPLALLVYRSRFLPRFLGVWLAVAGVAWVVLSLTSVLLPQYEERMYAVLQPAFFGEIAFMLWLVIKGARPPEPSGG